MIEEKRLRELIKNKGYVFFKNEYCLPDYFILNEKDFEIIYSIVPILYDKKTGLHYYLSSLTENLSELTKDIFDYSKKIEQLIKNCIKKNTEPSIEVIPIRVLLIEDGSVDENDLEKLNIPYLIYRQGANKPEIIEM